MKFMMIYNTDPDLVLGPAEEAQLDRELMTWCEELSRRGVRLGGGELDPPAAARTVRARDGETTVTDGPFAETKEFVAGYDILECADLEEATALVARNPAIRIGSIEVRRFA
jgi:hypothetical protein